MQIVPPVYLLQTLVVFAEQENLVQTAERLGLTQPTVSRQLQQLEELFPHPLFAQQGRNKVLTAYGMALAQELKPRFLDLERVFEKVDQTFSDPRSIHLRIGGRQEHLHHLFAEIQFQGSLELVEGDDQEVFDQIQNDNLDLAVSVTEISQGSIVSKKVFQEAPVLIIPNRWSEDVQSVRDWVGKCERYAFCEDRNEPSHLLKFENKYQVKALKQLISKDRTLLENKVHQQRAWAILPRSLVKEGRSYKIIPLAGLFESRPVYLHYRKDLAKFSWMKDFLNQILEESARK